MANEGYPPGGLPDDPEGFERFYQLIFERELPAHARVDWVEPLYAARAADKGLVVEAFRGSSKTTTLSIAFSAFRLGQEPHKSVLLIQAGNTMAASTSQQIADLIERNPGWHSAFPHVEPDRKIGWGTKGYEVRRTDLDYSVWRARCAREKGKDPSLVGLGYRSRAIIGKHPTGLLLVDDIHDETNTRSARELNLVMRILTGTILPTATPETWQVFVGTPWTQNDALAYLKSTGRFVSMRTPVYVAGSASNAGENERVPAETDGGREVLGETVPTWPERFPVKEIEKARQLSGEAEFARMYLLDLNAAEGIHLKGEWLNLYPHEKVQPNWPVVMGVDYASTADQLKGRDRDYFAVAIGRALPGGGGVVLVDGFRAQVSQGEAEQQLKALANYYPTTQVIAVEAVGKGEEFYHLLLRDWRLPVVPMQPGGKGKGVRFEKGMAPLFQMGRAWIADVENSFLQAFRQEWLRWPSGEHDDTLDAVHWMLMAAQDHLTGWPRRDKQENPFGSLGRR
ncbi:MAG: hypothetical protein WEA61_01920 [Anaerolineales bacterium]